MSEKPSESESRICPEQGELDAFSLGLLPPEAMTRIARHTEGCPSCLSKLEQLESLSDDLLARLRNPSEENPVLDESECRLMLERIEQLHGDTRVQCDEDSTHGISADEELALPRLLGQYRLIERLGRGGMGRVYKARHLKLKKFVALKVLAPGRMRDARAVARFHREMEAVGKLDHANIIRATDAGEGDDTHFLVMELADGMDLERLACRHGFLPIADACELVRQAALGLEYARQHGLVHRDVKPSNLLLTHDGAVKVLDLGLALLDLDRSSGDDLTSEDVVMGTVDYMAPEQAEDARSVDTRADIYSLGCTLYRLLCGQVPFDGRGYESKLKKIIAHSKVRVPALRSHRCDIPDKLAALVERMLEKDPGRRPSTPGEVASELAWFSGESDLVALLDSPAFESTPAADHPAFRQSTEQLSSRWRFGGADASGHSRGRRVAAAIAALLLLVGGGALLKTMTDGRGAPESISGNATESATESVTEAPLAPADPLSRLALVTHPLLTPEMGREGIESWTIEDRRHRGRVYDAEYSQDRSILATCGEDGTIRLWDGADPKLRRILVGHDREVVRVAWAPEGGRVASASRDGTIGIWDAATGRLVHRLDTGEGAARSVAWSSDGERLAASGDSGVGIWHAGTGEPVSTLLDRPPSTLAWAPAGEIQHVVAVASSELVLWDSRNAEQIRTFPFKTVNSHIMEFSPDGRKLAITTRDHLLIVDTLGETEVVAVPLRLKNVLRARWSPGGSWIAVTDEPDATRQVHILDVASGDWTDDQIHESSPGAIAWRSDSELLYSGRPGFRLFRIGGGQDSEYSLGVNGSGATIAWAPDGRDLVQFSHDKACVWELATATLKECFEGNARFGVWSPNRRWIAFGGFVEGILVRDLEAPSEDGLTDVGHQKQTWDERKHLAWFPYRQGFVYRDGYKRLRVWENGGEEQTLATFDENIVALAASRYRLAVAVGDEIIEFTAEGEERGRFTLDKKVEKLAFSSDGSSLAVAFEPPSRSVHVRNLAARDWSSIHSGHAEGVLDLRWTSDDRRIVAACYDGTIHIWSPDASEPHRELTAMGIVMSDAVVSPVGDSVAWSRRDGAVQIVTATSGDSVVVLVALQDEQRIAIGPGGHYGPARVQEGLVYVVRSEEGQRFLTPTEFEEMFGWRNDPALVRRR